MENYAHSSRHPHDTEACLYVNAQINAGCVTRSVELLLQMTLALSVALGNSVTKRYFRVSDDTFTLTPCKRNKSMRHFLHKTFSYKPTFILYKCIIQNLNLKKGHTKNTTKQRLQPLVKPLRTELIQ
jgi:hypothetical protein